MNLEFDHIKHENRVVRLSSGFGWVLSEQFERTLTDMLGQAGIKDVNRRSPSPIKKNLDDDRFNDRFEAVFAISVAARLAEMHPNTLRKYDRQGLVRPSRSQGRQRLYSETDVRRLRIVRNLAETYQINLNGVRLALDMIRLITGVVEILESADELDAFSSIQIAVTELKNLLAGLDE